MAKVLMYNLSGKPKLSGIKFALLRQGITGREVTPEEYEIPIGLLAGITAFDREDDGDEPEHVPFADEMLVLCGLSSAQLDGFLNELRRSKSTVELKAVTTVHNAGWSSYRLHRELASEHEALSGAKSGKAAKRSIHRK